MKSIFTFLIACIALSASAQTDIYVQANAFYADNTDIELLQLGAEAGLSLKKWDIAGLVSRSLTLDIEGLTAQPSHSTFAGAVLARKVNLKIIGLRFPLIVGMNDVSIEGTVGPDAEFTISPGAQLCIGKYRTQLGVGYQYFWTPDAAFDAYNSGSLSAFVRFNLF